MLLESSQVQRMIEIAKMYYEEGLTQAEIAKKFDVSRALIASQLSQAKEIGIVSIEIKSPFMGNEDLLLRLKKKFGIKGGVITPASKGEFYKERVLISQSSAFIAELVERATCIGMGWGFTLDEVVTAFPLLENGTHKKNVCPLLANLDSPHRGFHPNELSRVFAEKIKADSMYLFAPVFPLSLQEQQQFLNTENYKQIEQMWNDLDLAIVSIASFPSVPDLATAYRYGEKVIEERVVGDFISYCFNEAGDVIEGENDFAIRISLDSLKKIKNVVAICPSTLSAETVKGALNTGIVSNVIMDEQLAYQCLCP